MRRLNATLVVLAALLSAVTAAGAAGNGNGPRVTIETDRGNIVLALFPDKAPETVRNFLAYVDSGHYQGTSFHRVIENFVIQAGGYDASYQPLAEGEAIRNEANNGLGNEAGTVAMARLDGDPHSATDQFFINLKNNWYLDHSSETRLGWGYCVFGQVVEGLEVARDIATVETGAVGELEEDAPLKPIIIQRIHRTQPQGPNGPAATRDTP